MCVYIYISLSADPCRQQGECVREEVASPSGPGCLGSATWSFDRSCAGGKPAQASWQLAVREGKQKEGFMRVPFCPSRPAK